MPFPLHPPAPGLLHGEEMVFHSEEGLELGPWLLLCARGRKGVAIPENMLTKLACTRHIPG